MTRPAILLYEPIRETSRDLLRQHAEVRIAERLDEDYVIGAVPEVRGIIIHAYGNVTQRINEAAPPLRVIGRHGAGVETIDRETAAERGVVVVNVPDASAGPVAEHCPGMILVLARRMFKADRAPRGGNWQARDRLTGRELSGKTLGIVGLGRIGQRLAAICREALGMRILYHDVRGYPEIEAAVPTVRLPLAAVLEEPDFISVCVPLTPATRGLIDEVALRQMKSTAYLINTARGPVVDEAALIGALREGWIAGAGLDVYETEPLPLDSPLLTLENIVLAPHVAAHTEEALERTAVVVEDVLAVIQGHPPRHPVLWED